MTTNQQAPKQFIQSLKRAGIVIGNEREVIYLFGVAREWRDALSTLANHGKTLGIWFAAGAKIRSTQLKRLFAKFNFTGQTEAAFESFFIA